MFEHSQKYQGGERAILVALEMPDTDESDVFEFQELVSSAEVEALVLISGKRTSPDSKYFVGKGKAEEIKTAVDSFDADVVIINHDLTPSQSRNLETLCQRRVIDRTGLILDIFAQRAQSFEGKLQVELAQLTHISTRLVRMWTHLERQRGGVGLRGPGETQLESDKRMIGIRIKQIQKKLQKVTQTRLQGRLSRQRSQTPTIAFVGYTNAGKSSLFNKITDSGVYVKDQLFATLDPTHRAAHIPQVGNVILADTVGFISKLPHELVTAFHSTLQESVEADLLLEIIDAVDPERAYKTQEVASVLEEIGADIVSRIKVFNKIDLNSEITAHLERNDQGDITAVWVSTLNGQGIDLIYQAIAEHFQKTHIKAHLVLSPEASKLRAQLFNLDAITHEEISEEGQYILTLHVAKRHLTKLTKESELAKKFLEPLLNHANSDENW